MIKIIDINGSNTQPDNQGEPTLAKLREWINCDYIEVACVFYKGEYEQLVIDENGRLEGKPHNPYATEIYLNDAKVHDPGRCPIALQSLVNNIVGIAVLLTGENKLT